MKKLINDYLLSQCVCVDRLRPALASVQNLDGVLYATDARLLVRIDADKCFRKYKFQEKYPDAKSVINGHEELERKTFKTSDLLEELLKIQMLFVPNTEDCEKCEGEGYIECPCCNNDSDCKECDGEGEIVTELLKPNDSASVSFFGRFYKINYLELIFRIAHFTGVEDMEVINGGASAIFKVGDFEILLMSYLKS